MDETTPTPVELSDEEHAEIQARTFALASEPVRLTVMIPRRLADGLAELAEESRRTPMPATVSTLAADAIEGYLNRQRPRRG